MASAILEIDGSVALLRVLAVVCAKVLDTADIVREAIFQQLSNGKN